MKASIISRSIVMCFLLAVSVFFRGTLQDASKLNVRLQLVGTANQTLIDQEAAADVVAKYVLQEPTAESNPSTTSIPIVVPDDNTPTHPFSQALDAFAQVLHDNPEATGVRPWSWNSSSSSWHFDGLTSSLLEEAFGGRTVGFLGDSTLFYMVKWFQALLLKSSIPQLDSLQTMPLSQANLVVNPTMDRFCGFKGLKEVQVMEGQYRIQWKGFADSAGEEACKFMNAAWSDMRALKPDIMVVNWGLHWLHLLGGGPQRDKIRDAPACFVDLWLKYEAFLQTAIDVAVESNTRVLLFKTTNFICQEKFKGPYATTVAQFQQERQEQQLSTDSSPSQFDVCAKTMEAKIATANLQITRKDIVRYCREANLDLVGSQQLNQRMIEFVNQKKEVLLEQSNLTIALYNDHDLQSCPHTKESDGRHYHPLNLLRIRLLANTIQALFPRPGKGGSDSDKNAIEVTRGEKV